MYTEQDLAEVEAYRQVPEGWFEKINSTMIQTGINGIDALSTLLYFYNVGNQQLFTKLEHSLLSAGLFTVGMIVDVASTVVAMNAYNQAKDKGSDTEAGETHFLLQDVKDSKHLLYNPKLHLSLLTGFIGSIALPGFGIANAGSRAVVALNNLRIARRFKVRVDVLDSFHS